MSVKSRREYELSSKRPDVLDSVRPRQSIKEQMLCRMEEEEQHVRKNIVKQTLVYSGHDMRGFSGLNALLVLEGKFDGKKMRPTQKNMDR